MLLDTAYRVEHASFTPCALVKMWSLTPLNLLSLTFKKVGVLLQVFWAEGRGVNHILQLSFRPSKYIL